MTTAGSAPPDDLEVDERPEDPNLEPDDGEGASERVGGDGPEGAEQATERADGPRNVVARVVAVAFAHPVATTALLGVGFVVFQMWWITRARHLGSFDVDEAGGLAAALRFHRSLDFDPRPLQQVVFDTRNGPLVPLLSVPFLVVGPRTVATAMMVQPVLVVAAACGAAGILNATRHRRAALLAGVMVMGISVSVVSSRSYQYSTGVAAFLSLAMWALAASDRGRDRRRMVLFGVALGAMVLCRTMAAGFVPGALAAALVIVVRERRVWKNLGLAALAAFVVAGPWWIAQLRSILDYLFENAYGDRAHYWGSVGYGDRLQDHIHYVLNDFRVVIGIVHATLALVLLNFVVSRRTGRPFSTAVGSWRILGATWLCFAVGTVALLSTANRGFWFAHPLDVLMVAGLVGLVAHLSGGGSRWFARLKVGAACVALVGVGLTLFASLDLTGPGLGHDPQRTRSELFMTQLDRLQLGNLEADVRLASEDLDVRLGASREWYDAGVELAEEIARIEKDNGTLWQSVTGEIHLFNANTIGLAQEASRTGINGIHVVNTLEPPDDVLRRDLTPFRQGIPRVLVIVDGRSLEFPDGRGHDRFERLARAEGWRPSRRIPLPDGGEVVVHTHPESVSEG